jgi:hypothetical protein
MDGSATIGRGGAQSALTPLMPTAPTRIVGKLCATMATRRTTFEKLQRERDKKAKAAAKRERRQERAAAERMAEGLEAPGGTVIESTESEEAEEAVPNLSPAEILEQIEVAHEQYKAGRMTSEAFEERKTELLTQLAALPIE